ncbi:MAG: hypothetical protein M3R13_01240 [Armatimonadota bacterium]|nr:hypothetical protein [Armatimonadota bacterium]
MRRVGRGITYVEVLVVLAILMTLSAIGLVVGRHAKESIGRGTCATHLRSLHGAIEIYRAHWGNPSIAAGDIGLMGLPHDWIATAEAVRTKTPLFGTWDEWKCPAPKAKPGDYMPHYAYLAWPGSDYAQHVSVYRGRTPILLDRNHNDHVTNSVYSPRVPKFIMFIDLDGSFVSKTVHSSFISGTDLKFFELE